MQVYNNQRFISEALSLKSNNIQQNRPVEEKASNSSNFQDILNNKISKSNIQFSKHASMRLDNRRISLTDDQMKRVEEGIDKATQKGISDSLVLVDDVALVVNVKNRIVITAMDKDVQKDNVFTNIDGAVIV